MINDLREPGFSSHSWRLALETMKTQGETQGETQGLTKAMSMLINFTNLAGQLQSLSNSLLLGRELDEKKCYL